MAQARDALAQPEQLVDLLLVLREYQFCAAVAQQVGDFLGQRVAIHAKNFDGADRMAGNLAGEPIRPVVANQGDDVAAFDPSSSMPRAKSRTRDW